MRELRYCIAHTLTARYATQVNLGVQSFGISPAIRFVLSANEHFTLKFVVNSNRKTGKIPFFASIDFSVGAL